MSLENFRKLRITLTDANEAIIRKLVAKEGDSNGRELEIQIIDGHQFDDLSNAQVIFNWKHLRMGNSGNKYFEAVNADEGIFKVAYPESMLNAGNVRAWVTIEYNGVINTKNFTILVEGTGGYAQTAIASDDFQALNDALVRIGNYQREIDDIKDDLENQADNLIDSERNRIGRILDDIQPQMDGLESQFNDAVANVTQDSEVITARTSTETGDSYESLGNRLDEIETMIILDEHKGYFEIDNGQPRIRLEEI